MHRRVARHEGCGYGLCLGDEEAIEGVAVVPREPFGGSGMVDADRQRLRPGIELGDHLRALATYFLPARTITVFFFTKSRTETRPRTTRVSVEAQRSSTSHLVPTTVAALCLPLVRNLPLPSPQSRRVLLAAAMARPAFGQLSASTSVSVVSGRAPLPWVRRNMPP